MLGWKVATLPASTKEGIMADEKTTYLVEFVGGKKRKITVPSNWKVTFGPCVVKQQKGPYGREMPLALRFYENETKQRAIFTEVKSFVDMSIKIEEEQINTQEKVGFTEVDGKRKATSFQVKTKEWIDPFAESDPSDKPQISWGDYDGLD